MVDTLPSPAQQEIADTVAAYLGRQLPLDRLSGFRGAEPLLEPGAWNEIAQMGWLALGLPEEAGGAGCGAAEEYLLLRQAGRFALSPSLPATMLAVHLCDASGAVQPRDDMISGRRRASLAISATGMDGSRRVLSFDRAAGDMILLIDGRAAALFAPEGAREWIETPGLDGHVRLCKGDLSGAMPVAEAPEAGAFGLRLALFVSSALLGIAEAARDMAVEYAGTREQFGRTIGSFQAIKHRCADMAVACEAAAAQATIAAMSIDDAADDATLQVIAARYLCEKAAMDNTTAAIQLHGAMGFTAACGAHRLLKRAHLWGQVGGDVRSNLDLLVRQPRPAYV